MYIYIWVDIPPFYNFQISASKKARDLILGSLESLMPKLCNRL